MKSLHLALHELYEGRVWRNLTFMDYLPCDEAEAERDALHYLREGLSGHIIDRVELFAQTEDRRWSLKTWTVGPSTQSTLDSVSAGRPLDSYLSDDGRIIQHIIRVSGSGTAPSLTLNPREAETLSDMYSLVVERPLRHSRMLSRSFDRLDREQLIKEQQRLAWLEDREKYGPITGSYYPT